MKLKEISRFKLVAAIVVLFLALITAIFLRPDSDDHDMDMHATSQLNKFSNSDQMFLQMMIPHHQQAIDISQVALKKSENLEITKLAKTIISAQTAEIQQMKNWLKDSGVSTHMGHAMEGMNGVLSDEELKSLDEAVGTKFDQEWLKAMIEHHDGAILMTKMIQDANDLKLKNFGKKIIEDQSSQILLMKKILSQIS